MQCYKNIIRIEKPTILPVCIFVFILITLTGCATTATTGKKSSGITNSQEATDIWHSYEILPNYHYYFYGPVSQPFYIIGIDDQYLLKSTHWKPIDLTPEMLKNWINYIQPRVGYSPSLWGALITGPNGKRIGLWYSVRDWRRLGSADLGESNQVSITTPSVTDPRTNGFLLQHLFMVD